jgi:hypothetical protein
VDININSYSNTTIPAAAAALGEKDRPTQDGAAAAPCLSEEGEKPPGRPAAAGGAHTRQVQAAAAPVPKNTESPNVPAFKAALEAVNPSLVFDSGFYPRARAWLTRHSLPVDFLSWLYEQCLRKKPSSVRGMFRTLFFAPDMTSFFKSLHTPPPERPLVSCPLCGASHDARDDLCPACGLKKDAQEQDILFHRHLLSLPPDRRAVYENQVRIIFTAGLDFREQKRRLDALHKDFAFP